MFFEVRDELFTDCDHCLEQWLSDLTADERVGGIDDVVVAYVICIAQHDTAMSQSVGSDHALIVSMVLIEAYQSSEQGDAKLLKGGVVGLLAALWINAADEDAGIAAGTGRLVLL